MPKFYVYRHIRTDIEPNVSFYIGIGAKSKWNPVATTSEYSRAYNVLQRSSTWIGYTKKHTFEVEILFESDNYDEIKEKEKEFIALYGRKNLGTGTLINLTDGGDGSIGYIASEEARINTGKAKRGIKLSKEHREKISRSNLGRMPSPETIAKISAKNRGRKASAETIEKLKISHTGYRWNDDSRKKVSESMRKVRLDNKRPPISEETRMKMRMAKAGKPSAKKDFSVSKETREKISATLKKRNQLIRENARVD